MTTLQTLALVGAVVWMGILTVVVVLVVRQIAILTSRLERGVFHDMGADGPEIGTALDEAVLTALPRLRSSTNSYVLLMSATCGPCREVAPALGDLGIEPRVITLLPGREELAEPMAKELPGHFDVVRDPLASQLADKLQIESTPFALQVKAGAVAGKTYIREAKDLANLIDVAERGRRIEREGQYVG